jgi:hypothetical protein
MVSDETININSTPDKVIKQTLKARMDKGRGTRVKKEDDVCILYSALRSEYNNLHPLYLKPRTA